MNDLRRLVAVLLAAIALAACGSDAAPAKIDVADPWGSPTPPGAENAAFYARFENDTGAEDQLTDGYSASCDDIQVHTTTMTDGVMSMEPATEADLLIADGASLEFEPGGLHVMCVGLVEPLVEGESAQLELTFANTGVIVFDVPIEQREG